MVCNNYILNSHARPPYTRRPKKIAVADPTLDFGYGIKITAEHEIKQSFSGMCIVCIHNTGDPVKIKKEPIYGK